LIEPSTSIEKHEASLKKMLRTIFGAFVKFGKIWEIFAAFLRFGKSFAVFVKFKEYFLHL
jgi:hypothetical protein